MFQVVITDQCFSKIIDLAKEQKKENVFAVIKTNDFTCGFKKRHCDLFSSNTRKPDYDEQIKIFIGSWTTVNRSGAFMNTGKFQKSIQTTEDKSSLMI